MRKWLPLVAVCLGSFMLLIDITIVNVALPDMSVDLHMSLSSVQWVIDAYLLTLASLVLGAGTIADKLGHRRGYVAGLVLFAIASLCCGIAPNASVIIAARLVQGVGAAIMFATTFALLNSSYQGRDRGTAYGLWGAVVSASAAIGPVLGGLLTEGINWRWIFIVNLPVSVVAVAMCLWVFAVDRPDQTRRVDVAGIVTFTAAVAALTYGLIRANAVGWASIDAWGFLIVGALVFVAFTVVEARGKQPMLELSLLRNRSFAGVLIAALLLNFAAFSYVTYTSIWLQSVLGLSPIQAGLTSIPLSVTSVVASAMIGRVMHRFAPGPVIGIGMMLIGVGGLISAVLVHGGSSWPSLMPGFVLVGIGVGLSTPTLSSSAMLAVPVQRGGMAGGTVNTARQLGYAIGIALLGSVFAARATSSLAAHGHPNASTTAHELAGGQSGALLAQTPPAGRAALDHLLRTASISGLDGTFWVAGIAGVLAAVAVFALVRTPRVGNQRAVAPRASEPADAPTGTPTDTPTAAPTAAELA